MTADPEALALMAGLVLEDGRRWGEAAEEWQWDAVRWLFDRDGTPNRFETRPRGASKTTDLSGATSVAMLTILPPGSRCYAI